MKQQDHKARVTKLLTILADMSAVEALQALNQANADVLQRIERARTTTFHNPVVPVPTHLIERHRGRQPMIENDPELRDFIHGLATLERKLTFKEIADECAIKFGPDRAPTKSAIHRYSQRLKKRISDTRGSTNE